MTAATWLLIAALAFGVAVAGLLAWRLRGKLPPLPDWSWRNVMALVALAATIFGAGVLTLLAWWLLDGFGDDARRLIDELVRDRNASGTVGEVLVINYKAQAWGLKLLLGGVLVVLLSLGLAITPRKVVINKTGAELSGGDGDADPAVAAARLTAKAADDKAEQIAERAAARADDPLPRP